MQIKDFEDLISNLNMVDVSLKQNIQKLDKFDVEKQIQKLSTQNIAQNLTQEFEKQLSIAAEILEDQNKELIDRIETFRRASDNLMQIDTIAENIETIVEQNKKLNRSYKVIPAVVIAVTVGAFSFFASNINAYFSQIIPGENKFIERFPNAQFIIGQDRNIIYLQMPQDTKVTQIDTVNGLYVGFQEAKK